MMFGSIVVSGVRTISCYINVVTFQRSTKHEHCCTKCYIGLGFTQTPQIFRIFPDLFKTYLQKNCVAVVFIVAQLY